MLSVTYTVSQNYNRSLKALVNTFITVSQNYNTSLEALVNTFITVSQNYNTSLEGLVNTFITLDISTSNMITSLRVHGCAYILNKLRSHKVQFKQNR